MSTNAAPSPHTDPPEALPHHAAWTDSSSADALPGAPAVFQLVDDGGRNVLLATTQHLRRAVATRLDAPSDRPTRRADLAAVVRGVRWRRVSCAFEARWWHYRLARRLYPRDYRKRIGFRPAWFLCIDPRDETEIRVSERVCSEPAAFVGPWPSSKAAHEALTGLWDVFDLCRHPEQLRKRPGGLRCAYFDMRRCDAPCDATAPREPMAERCRDAWRFACGGAAEWADKAAARMRQAAQEQRFEQAALLKTQIAFARRWAAEWQPKTWPLERFEFLLVLPATRRKAWKVFTFEQGSFRDGPLLKNAEMPAAARAWAATDETTPGSADATERMEQTWLMAHLLNSREADTAAIVPLDLVRTNAQDARAALSAAAQRRG